MNWRLLSLAQGNRQTDTHGKGRNGERTEASLLLEWIQARLCMFDGVGGCMRPTLLRKLKIVVGDGSNRWEVVVAVMMVVVRESTKWRAVIFYEYCRMSRL